MTPVEASNPSIVRISARLVLLICWALCLLPGVVRADSALEMERMTWPELAQRVEAGAVTVLVPTGGVEQSGPHLALGKHNVVIRAAALGVARQLGQTLVAPVVPVVPEGPWEGRTGHFAWPGTLGLSEATFAAVLQELALSLVQSGFRNIVFLGDHGPSQAVQRRVAEALNPTLAGQGVRIIHLDRYYDPARDDAALARQGYSPAQLGDHGGMADTVALMASDGSAVRLAQRDLRQWRGARPAGATGRPDLATRQQGEILMALRIRDAVQQLRQLGLGTAPKPGR